ncbi:hypothetical protein Btru_067240 [Bulinus truncatus]|nr:hypothetical protein Btru_067240 [Bulinus truncatus]
MDPFASKVLDMGWENYARGSHMFRCVALSGPRSASLLQASATSRIIDIRTHQLSLHIPENVDSCSDCNVKVHPWDILCGSLSRRLSKSIDKSSHGIKGTHFGRGSHP